MDSFGEDPVNDNDYYCDKESKDHEIETDLVKELPPAHLYDDLVSFVKALCNLGVLVRHIDDDISLVSQPLVSFSHIIIRFKPEFLDVL